MSLFDTKDHTQLRGDQLAAKCEVQAVDLATPGLAQVGRGLKKLQIGLQGAGDEVGPGKARVIYNWLTPTLNPLAKKPMPSYLVCGG